MTSRRVAAPAALAVLTLITGCGSAASHSASSRELALQRAQFAQLSGGLRSAEGEVRREVSAARGAWPLIADGLPRVLPAPLRRAVHAASVAAKALREPTFTKNAAQLTGPAAGIVGIYESYERLAERGWPLIAASIDAILGGAPAVASFERQNSSLYIDTVYDAHFDLSLLGKSLTSAYERLGGQVAFGATLTQGELNTLAAAYSIPAVRLEPHPGRSVEEP